MEYVKNNIHIIIPVRNSVKVTSDICLQLQKQIGWKKCWIYDNGSTDDTPNYLNFLKNSDSRFFSVQTPNLNIYQMWELGIDSALKEGADYVAILNNDLILAPDTILALANALDEDEDYWISYPDYEKRVQNESHYPSGILNKTWGTYRHNGMCGYCFMIKAKNFTWKPLIDPEFKLWYGDDDLAFETEFRGGQQVKVMGLPLDHIGQVTTRNFPELYDLIKKDREKFLQKWKHWLLETRGFDEN